MGFAFVVATVLIPQNEIEESYVLKLPYAVWQ